MRRVNNLPISYVIFSLESRVCRLFLNKDFVEYDFHYVELLFAGIMFLRY